MAITSKHVTGFMIGLGAAAAGYIMYKQNQDKVDAFLRERGINMPADSGKDPSAMSLEELVTRREHLEDLIAEKEYAASQAAPEEEAPGEEKKKKA